MGSLVSVPAQVVDLKPRADKSWKISFETRELAGEDVKILADNFQGEGWLLFKPNGLIVPEEIPLDQADSGAKSPSQKLRSVMYVYWKQTNGKGDFDSFYRVQYDRLIELYKEKIDAQDTDP